MMKYKAIEQTVQAVQITPDIDMIAPDWFTKKMNTEEIMIDRVQKDGATAVIGARSILMHEDIKAADLLQE